jgi:hypothetical protein
MSTISSKEKVLAKAKELSTVMLEILTPLNIEVRTMQQSLAIVKPMRFDRRKEEVNLFVL